MLRYYFSIFLILSTLIFAQAQTGKVTGKILDGEFNDVLAFANVIVKDSQKGTTSDFDGVYSIELNPGTYTLVYSFIGYETKAITGVEVTANGVLEINVTLRPSSATLDEVVITTTARRNTEEAVLNIQRNSAVLLDGLSIESIKNLVQAI